MTTKVARMDIYSTQGGEMRSTEARNATGVLLCFRVTGMLLCVVQLVAGGIMGG